jgi:hypothetical protein
LILHNISSNNNGLKYISAKTKGGGVCPSRLPPDDFFLSELGPLLGIPVFHLSEDQMPTLSGSGDSPPTI